VIVLSVRSETVRDILIAAHQLGMVQSGEFVFFDVVLFEFFSYWGNPNWERGDEFDDIAREAYEALLRVSLLEPEDAEYETWRAKVKQRARDVYGFDFEAHNESVNFFIGTFHDAILLYGLGVSECIAGGNCSYRDGLGMNNFFWNRSFIGKLYFIIAYYNILLVCCL
jgi:atrial natriuretic peptide receptor A